jgi:pimeloyl-ACP methyl ester carboxylesterase
MHLHCVGAGSPTVVLDSGLGNHGGIWHYVQGDIGAFTRVCAYDRLGVGYSSSPAPRPHTNRQMVAELHTLLGQAGVGGPYVLVGHSMAGINVRLFASAHPEEVAGMVLVDVSTEDQAVRYWPLIQATESERNAFRAEMSRGAEGFDYETFLAGFADLRTSSRTLGERPLVVLSAGKNVLPPGTPPEQVEPARKAWQELQAELPRLSTNSAQVVAEQCGHYIQLQAPMLVIAAVRQVVQAVRKGGRVDASALRPLAQKPPVTPGG